MNLSENEKRTPMIEEAAEYTDDEIIEILDEYEEQCGENMHCPRCHKQVICESRKDEGDSTTIKVSFRCKECRLSQNITIVKNIS